ncbi:DNA polymerase III subunit epsilon [Henriciella aquimarina]|uniref:DNA polymerase III subunit epsilon n=1 Tax=Henriciella aquimarina TaxID=545261 RepID=UPI0009FEC013|nr:DNA polymerase III subunit epsilon [Henriciella aquimarina]
MSTHLREIAFDTETTGLDWAGDDRIIEVGAVELVNHVPTGLTFHERINPRRPVSAKTIEITGITDDMLVDKPYFEDPVIVDALLEFIGDSPIVAHNASFDRSFLNAELVRCGKVETIETQWVDTLEMAKKRYPGAPASLDALCKRFNVNAEARTLHGALLDSQLLAEVYLELRGGRARSFDFSDGLDDGDSARFRVAHQRPQPLPSLVTGDEAEQHAAFIAELGDNAIWSNYRD